MKECDRQGYCSLCRNGVCTSSDEYQYDHCFNTERWQKHLSEKKPIIVFPSKRTLSIPYVIEGATIHYYGAQPYDIENDLK